MSKFQKYLYAMDFEIACSLINKLPSLLGVRNWLLNYSRYSWLIGLVGDLWSLNAHGCIICKCAFEMVLSGNNWSRSIP